MFTGWSAVAAKAKVTAIVAAGVTAGGLGGTVALRQVAPDRRPATPTAAPSGDETTAAPTMTPTPQDVQASGATPTAGPGDPTSGSGQDLGSAGAAPPSCAESTATHGDAVAAVATTRPSPGAQHGQAVSPVARDDCGKPAQAHPPADRRSAAKTSHRAPQATPHASPRPTHSPAAPHSSADTAPSHGSDQDTRSSDHGTATRNGMAER